MILIDSNIPMYLIGADHPNKLAAQHALERLAVAGERLVTDVEVLQEILHRYVAIKRESVIQAAYDALLGVVDEIFPIELADLERAKNLILGGVRASARDVLHVAVMQRRGVPTVLSFDRGFDSFPGISRIDRY